MPKNDKYDWLKKEIKKQKDKEINLEKEMQKRRLNIINKYNLNSKVKKN